MLTRQDDQFRAIAEVVERLCLEAAVEVHPGIVDALIRRWLLLVARAWTETGQAASMGVPADLSQVVAEDLIAADRQLRAQRGTAPAGSCC